ncbi:MAG: hypothetical protein LJE65_13080 [Desulfobacteraceae bacterium]|nr:hypothetical protein [Desulfobacteraceae bacterium]
MGRWILALAALMWLIGCATVPPPAKIQPSTAEAEAIRLASLLSVADKAHAVPASFKGTGTLSIHRGNRDQKARIAWAGKQPEKLRVEVFGLPGFSSASVAMDEKTFYFRSRNPPRLTQHSRNAVDLSDIFGVDIRPGDLFRLLGGGLPSSPGRFTLLQPQPDDASRYPAQLVAKRWLGTVSQKLFFEPGEKRVGAAEYFDFFGRLRYRVTFDGQHSPPGGGNFRALSVTAPNSDRFRLEVERFWQEAKVDDSVFVLSQPPDASAKNKKP